MYFATFDEVTSEGKYKNAITFEHNPSDARERHFRVVVTNSQCSRFHVTIAEILANAINELRLLDIVRSRMAKEDRDRHNELLSWLGTDRERNRAVEGLRDDGGFDFEAARSGVDAAFDHDFAEVAGSGELDIFGHDVGGFDGAAEAGEQGAADVGDEVFGCAGAGGDEHALFACGEPGKVKFAGVV